MLSFTLHPEGITKKNIFPKSNLQVTMANIPGSPLLLFLLEVHCCLKWLSGLCRVQVSEDGMKSLVRLANGDMRKALNILQVGGKIFLSL